MANRNRHQKKNVAPASTDAPRNQVAATGDGVAATIKVGPRQAVLALVILAVGALGYLWATGTVSTPSVPEVDHTSSLWLIFLTGLSVGGLSCLAVQGGLLAAMIAQRDSRQMDEQGAVDTSGLRRSMPVVQFLVAKIAAYAALGALLGAFGSLIPISFQGWLMVIAGVFMLIVVLQMFDVHPFFRRFSFSPPKSVRRYIRRRSKGDGRATPFVLGALTVFIPCGVTLAMEALAIASNDPVRGALLMMAFTMGTAPLFLVLGVAATKMSTSFNRVFRPVAAVAIVAVAIMTVVSGARLLGYGTMFVRGESTTATIIDRPAVGSAAESSEANAASSAPGAHAPASSPAESAAEAGAPAAAGAEAGTYQEATIDVATGQYYPSVVQVKAGLPTRLNLNTKETQGCIRSFVIPSLGIQTSLAETGSQVVELPPAKPGRIPFMCSMGMYTGVIEVVN